MATEWFYARDGKQHGPVDISTLKALAEAAQLFPEDLVWREGMADWQIAGSVPELKLAKNESAVAVRPDLVEYDNPYAAPLTIDDEVQMPAGNQYARFLPRAAAMLIDYVIIVGAHNLIVQAFQALGILEALLGFRFAFGEGILLMAAGYFAGFESSRLQATPGKAALGLKVVDLNVQRISFFRALGRTIAKYFSTILFGAGYLMAAFTSKHQCLHDMVGGTLVVHRRR